jgi:kynurenine 3-monooxygenase
VAYGVGVAKKVAPGQEDDDGRIAGDGKVKEYKSGEEDRDGTGFDLVVGCDGTWSKVRSEMMRAERWVRRFQPVDSDFAVGTAGMSVKEAGWEC